MQKMMGGVAAIALLVGMSGPVAAQEEKFITIGTGGQTGVY